MIYHSLLSVSLESAEHSNRIKTTLEAFQLQTVVQDLYYPNEGVLLQLVPALLLLVGLEILSLVEPSVSSAIPEVAQPCPRLKVSLHVNQRLDGWCSLI